MLRPPSMRGRAVRPAEQFPLGSGCWDWGSYTDSRYATKDGAQIRAVLGMVERLGAPR